MNTKRITNCTILLALLLCIVSTSIHAKNPALPNTNGNSSNNDGSVILNSQNFPDDVFRAYVSSITDVAEGGTLSEQTLQSVTSIYVSGMGISCLKGVEYFTALTELYCSGNQLTSIDVSACTVLKDLECCDNQLTSLNVSGCTALTNLYCFWNHLYSLDLSSCPSINTISCRDQGCLLYATPISSGQYSIVIPSDLDFSRVSEFKVDNKSITPEVINNTLIISSSSTPQTLTYKYDMGHNEKMYVQCSIAREGELNFILLNPTNFPDEAFLRFISERTGVAKSGFITEGIIQSIEEMDLRYYNRINGILNLNGIYTLKGIEFFTSLKKLMCSGNYTYELDVSHNIMLTELNCSDNHLTSLDLSQNTALTKLDCSTNQLTSLDLSHNSALTKLDCRTNQLTSLNLAGCNMLSDINCQDNHLTSLNLSECTALTKLDCSHNYSLTGLDVSNNTALTGLECVYNGLTSLDVSNNTALEWLFCEHNPLTSLDVSNNTALTDLDCEHNLLTSLDVSNNTALTDLCCGYNDLTSLDVSNNTALTGLGCEDNDLTSLDVSNNTALISLGCGYNQLTSLDVSKNTALKLLGCGYNQLTSLDVSNNTVLVYLECVNNQLTNLDVSNNTALKYLYCGNNQLMYLDLSKCPIKTNLEHYSVGEVSQKVPLSAFSMTTNQYRVCVPHELDGTKLSDFKVNGLATTPQLSNCLLSFTAPNTPTTITYCYDTGNETAGKMNVTVNITGIETPNENTVYMDDVELLAGTENILSVKMRNTVPIEGFEFDMYLPEGVTVVMDEDGFPEASLSTERTTPRKTNSFDAVMQADGSLRVLAASTNGSTISGNDGEIVTVKVTVDEDMAEGDHFIVLKNIAMSDANATSHKTELMASTMTVTYGILGDANTDKRVDVGDYTATAHHILGNTPNPFNKKAANANQDNAIDVGDLTAIAHIILYGSVTIPQNNANARPRQAIDRQNGTGYPDNYVYISPVSVSAGTEYTLSVNMKNDVDAEGFEFDLYLPEGMSFVVDADGFPDASLSTARTTARKTNTFDAVIQPDGALRVLAASSNASVIDGHDGEVALVKIRVDKGLIADTYTMQLKNIAIADVDAVSHYTEELDAIVTVMPGVPTFVDGIDSEDYGNHEFYNLSGQRIDKPTQPGIYIQRGKKVVIK